MSDKFLGKENFHVQPEKFKNKKVMDSGLCRIGLQLSSARQDEPAPIIGSDGNEYFYNAQKLLDKNSPLNISKIIHRIKRKTATDIRKGLHINFQWQKSFYNFNIFSQKKYLEELKYIHNNQYKDSAYSIRTRILIPQ